MAAKVVPIWIVIAVSVGMTAVSVGISYAMRKKPRLGDADPNEHDSNIVDTDAFMPVLMGEAVAPVFIVFADVDPDDANDLHIVGVFSYGEIESVEKIYFDNMQAVTKKVGDNFDVREEYDDYLEIQIRRGAPGNIDRPYEKCVKTFKSWTSKHTSGMLASFYMVITFKEDLFTSLPNVFILGKGKKIYDLRSGQTVWTKNAALWVLHFLTDPVYGKGLNINTEIDKASFIAEANYCDEIMTFSRNLLPGKVEPRLVKKNDNPLPAGTYYLKYSYCRGVIIWSENEPYYFYESYLSPFRQIVVTSSYGEIVLSNIANEPDDEATMKRIYRTEKDAAANSTYYMVKEIDYNTTSTYIRSNKSKQAFDNGYGTGGLSTPVSPLDASYTDYSGSGLQKNKKYKYKCSYVINPGISEGETIPSPASKAIKTTSSSNTVKLPSPILKDADVTHIRWYRTQGYDSGTKTNDEFYKLVDVPISTVEYTDMLSDAQLDLGKTPVTTSTFYSTMNRFTCCGTLDTGDDQDSLLEKLLSSCRARLYNVGGVYKIFIPKIAVPETFELTEDNIIGDWSFRILGMDKRPNVVRGTYINPDAEWKSDTVVWPKADKDNLYLKDDNDFKKVLDIDLPYTTDSRMAEMICQTIRKEARNNISVELTAKESARILTCGSLVKVTHSLPGWDKKKFWVDGLGIFPDRTVRLILVEYNEDDYVIETLAEETLPGADTNLGDPFAEPDEVTDVAFTEEEYKDKNQRKYRLKVTFTDPEASFWSYSGVYVKKGDNAEAEYEYYTRIDKYSHGVFYIEPIIEGVTYYLKIYSYNTFGKRQSEDETTVWSHTVSNFIPPPDIDPETINITVIESPTGSRAEATWEYNLNPADSSFVKDFNYFVVALSSDGTWDTVMKSAMTKTTWFSSTVTDGTWYFLVKAVDDNGNESNQSNIASKQFATGSDATWTTIINSAFNAGTHDGTERFDAGSGNYILRVKQNMLTNPGFSSDMLQWNTDGGNWKRITNVYKSSPAAAESTLGLGAVSLLYTNSTIDSNVEILAGKSYAFTAQVKSWQANKIRLRLELDSATTSYSKYHSGSGKWELLEVSTNTYTLTGSPKIAVEQAANPMLASYVDDCKYTRYSAAYRSSAYDRGVSAPDVVKIFKIEYAPITSQDTTGKIYIELGTSADNINYTFYSGLESGVLQITAKRYIKYKIRFVSVRPGELIAVDEDVGAGVACVLKWADPVSDDRQTVTDKLIPYGMGTTTLGESTYFAWEYL
ncbi:MAG: phage tail protein [Candidatus Brocadia sp.]|nr:phage tail protein [Candidatus Brocadia sp.]